MLKNNIFIYFLRPNFTKAYVSRLALSKYFIFNNKMIILNLILIHKKLIKKIINTVKPFQIILFSADKYFKYNEF